MTVFLFALAGIPPLGGWFAKFVVFRALVDPGTAPGYVLAVLVGVNSVIALFYYARIAQQMWMQPVPDDDRTPIRVPPSLVGALAICCIVTLVLGVLPGLVGDIGDLAQLAGCRPEPFVCMPERQHLTHLGSEAWLAVEPDRGSTGGADRRRSGRDRSRWSTPRCTTTTASTPARRRGRDGGVTSSQPEVGPLFGAVVARRAGRVVARARVSPIRSSSSRPAPGPGTLARAVLAASPACAPALR